MKKYNKHLLICLLLSAILTACDFGNDETLTNKSDNVYTSNYNFANTDGKFTKMDVCLIYPVNTRSGEYGLYKRDNDTGKVKKLSNDYVISTIFRDDYLYLSLLENPVYKSWEEGVVGEPVLYKMYLDEPMKTLVYQGEHYLIGILDKFIYFVGVEHNAQYHIYKINIDGTGIEKIVSGVSPYPRPKLHQNNIVFKKYDSCQKILEYNIKEKQTHELFSQNNLFTEGVIDNYKLVGDRMIFAISEGSESFIEWEGIYEYDMPSKILKQLVQANAAGGLAIIGKDIYFTTMDSHGDLNDLPNYYISYHVNCFDAKGILHECIVEVDDGYIGSIENEVYYIKKGKPCSYNVLNKKEEVLQ